MKVLLVCRCVTPQVGRRLARNLSRHCGRNSRAGYQCKVLCSVSSTDKFSALSIFQTDFILTVLRDMVAQYPDLRVVLMSATIDTTMFSNYFGACPIVDITGRSFPVDGKRPSLSYN